MIKNKARYCLLILIMSFFCEFPIFAAKIPSFPYNPEAQEQYYFALSHFRHDQYEEALNLAYKVIEDYPETEAAFKAEFLVGEALLKLHRKKEALKVFKGITKIPPDDYEAFEKKGSLLDKIKDFEGALDAYKNAFKVAQAENSPKTSSIRAELIEIEKVVANANLDKIFEPNNNSKTDYPTYSRYIKKAVELYEDVISAEGKTDFNYRHVIDRLGECYLYLKEYEKAEQIFKEVEKWAIANKEGGEPYGVHNSLVRVYLGNGDLPKLIDLYLRSREMGYWNAEHLVWDMMGFAKDAGRLPKLLSVMEGKNKHQNNPFLAYALSVGYGLAGNQDKAIIFCKKALELRPGTEEFYASLGWLYREKKMYPEEIDSFEKARALNPKVASYYCQIALAYMYYFPEKKDKMRSIAMIKEAFDNCRDDDYFLGTAAWDIYNKSIELGLRDKEFEDMLIKHRIMTNPK